MASVVSSNASGTAAETGAAGRNVWTVVLCWITVMLEGYDLVVLGAIIPILLKTSTGVTGDCPSRSGRVMTASQMAGRPGWLSRP
ncbi:hypothetical protein ACWEN3_33470, partial [Streptomyces sp. NPDC004561]